MRAVASLKILHFDVLILSKVHYVWVNKVQVSCVITLRNDAKFEVELTCIWKMMWKIRRILTQHSKVLKICTLMGFFWSKSLIVQLKKYRGDHYIELSYRRSMQALKEKWSVVSIMIWGIWWTSLEHSKILEFARWEAFFPRYTMLS